ncbi:MAG: hypothetical protein IJM39_05360 [Firmicutes bacterium]|nr:hypothetical protein [Bacillota bacterium]
MLFDRKSRRLRENLKKFSKKSVDLDKFVKDIYVDHGLAYISCNVSGYYDIIDRLSVEGYEWINGHFARFVEQNANYIPTEYPIVLEICGHRFTKAQQDAIEETIADYYALKMGDTQMALEKNKGRAIFLIIMALVFAGMVFISSRFSGGVLSVIVEVVFILFWVFVWELTDCLLFDRRDLKEARTEAAQLASVKVTFKERFEDEPVKPSEEKAIIREIFEDDVILPSDEW